MCGIGVIIEGVDVISLGTFLLNFPQTTSCSCSSLISTTSGINSLLLQVNSQDLQDLPTEKQLQSSLSSLLQLKLSHRGPDLSSSLSLTFGNFQTASINFFGSVLSLRGPPTYQPLFDHSSTTEKSTEIFSFSSTILLWNGEIFSSHDPTLNVNETENDTQILWKALEKSTNSVQISKTYCQGLCLKQSVSNDSENTETKICTKCSSISTSHSLVSKISEILDSLQGPFAFTFWHPQTKCLVYCRDRLGRRSLLHTLKFANVSPETTTTTDTTLSNQFPSSHVVISSVPVTSEEVISTTLDLSYNDSSSSSFSPLVSSETSLKNLILNWEELEPSKLFCIHLIEDQTQTVELRNDTLDLNKNQTNYRRPIALCSSFVRENLSISQSFPTLLSPLLPYSFSLSPSYYDSTQKKDLKNLNFEEVVNEFLFLLRQSVKLRCLDTSQLESDHKINESLREESNGKIGVLFSGGIDSLVLAALVDQCVPPNQSIDLINVAFKGTVSYENVAPDRITGRNGLVELRKISPLRDWRFVEVDVTMEELENERPHLTKLIYPCDTVMDLNIASALYFASRGRGHLFEEQNSELIQSRTCRYATTPTDITQDQEKNIQKSQNSLELSDLDLNNNPRREYQSTCKVLILGMGADEQLAGYGRHRTTFQQRGPDSLRKELENDFSRLWKRNLGRDDRVISSNGKEARFPFLDERLIYFLKNLTLEQICDLREPLGIGDKKILRRTAQLLGLNNGSSLVKRAIQFGTRIANNKIEGTAKLRNVKFSNNKQCRIDDGSTQESGEVDGDGDVDETEEQRREFWKAVLQSIKYYEKIGELTKEEAKKIRSLAFRKNEALKKIYKERRNSSARVNVIPLMKSLLTN